MLPQTADIKVGAPSGPVSIVRCDGYEIEGVRAAVREALAPLGGMAAFVKPGERIGLKPNLLLGSDPDQAIVTHPAVLAAVALEVKEAGATPIVVESPGAGIIPSPKVLARQFAKAGYQEVADRYGFTIAVEPEWDWVPYPDGRAFKRVEIVRSAHAGGRHHQRAQVQDPLVDDPHRRHQEPVRARPGADQGRLSREVPRERTLRGDAAGRGHAHAAAPQRHGRASWRWKARGPGTGGKPRKLGLVLAGTDTVSMDAVCCGIAGFDPQAIPVLVEARKRGLWGGRVADLPVIGPAVADLALRDFKPPAKGVASNGLELPIIGAVGRAFLRSGFSPRPRPQVGPCTICGSCEQACPVEAISMDKKARWPGWTTTSASAATAATRCAPTRPSSFDSPAWAEWCTDSAWSDGPRLHRPLRGLRVRAPARGCA